MNTQFTTEEWKNLTRAERIARCQTVAVECQELARTGEMELKAIYLDLAIHWLKLAQALDETFP